MGIVTRLVHRTRKEARPMAGIKVTTEQLSQLSASVARGSGEIDGILGSLRGQVGPLVAGDWAGQASVQFTAMFEQWQRAAGDLNAALHGISGLLANAASAYAQAEQQIAATFQR
jgi:WXG100 family type VII secretion target